MYLVPLYGFQFFLFSIGLPDPGLPYIYVVPPLCMVGFRPSYGSRDVVACNGNTRIKSAIFISSFCCTFCGLATGQQGSWLVAMYFVIPTSRHVVVVLRILEDPFLSDTRIDGICINSQHSIHVIHQHVALRYDSTPGFVLKCLKTSSSSGNC